MFEKSTSDARQDPELEEKPKRMSASKLRNVLYWLTLDWLHLSSMPSLGAKSVRSWELGRHSNVRDYGHPAEWASVKAAQIADLMTSWHDYLAEHRNETQPRRKRMRLDDYGTDVWAWAVNEKERVVAAWRYLEPRLEQLVELVDAEALKELPDLHYGIRRALGVSQPKYTLPMPCPNSDCQLLTLTRVVGAGKDFICCDHCGYTVKEEYYPLLIRITLDTLISEPQSGELYGTVNSTSTAVPNSA